jgi:hypothetical protein
LTHQECSLGISCGHPSAQPDGLYRGIPSACWRMDRVCRGKRLRNPKVKLHPLTWGSTCTCPHQLGSACGLRCTRRPGLHAPFVFRLNQAKESQPPKGPGGAPMCPNLEPDRAGSRRRCRPVPLLAAARRAGAVSTRYFLGLVRPFNPMVQGSSPATSTRNFSQLSVASSCRAPPG